MAAEFEFELSYFERFWAPIKKYIQTPKSRATAENIAPSEYFKVLDSAPPHVKSLLDRFEFDWEFALNPPKVEIRHKTPHSPEEVKRDIHALLRLFSKNEREYQKLLLHLSSIKAQTPEHDHLNLHIHASSTLDEPRITLYKKYQILTALEFLATNPIEDTHRLFESTHSSYQDNIWSKGMDRVVHFERIESRKRALSVDTDIDSLEKLFTENVETLEHQYNINIDAIATDSVLNKLINGPVDSVFFQRKVNLIQSIFTYLPDNLPIKQKLWENISKPSFDFIDKFITMKNSGSTVVDRLILLIILRHKAPANEQEKQFLESRIAERLPELTVSNQCELLSWLSLTFEPNDVKSILGSPYLTSLHKKFKRSLGAFAPDFEISSPKLASYIMSLSTHGADVPWKDELVALKSKILDSSSKNSKLLKALSLTYFKHPIEFIRNLNADERNLFLTNMKSLEINLDNDERIVHEQVKKYYSNGSLCKDHLQ